MDGTIEIICPLYNAENYIINLNKSFNMQEKANLKKVTYLLTESEDKSEQILKENNLNYEIIKKEEFSHSVTRENAAMKSKEDIIVFVSQDVVIENKDWLFELTKDITDDDIVACYSKQISKYDNLEKYTREFNYPNYDIVKSKEDIPKMGIKTFFSSDASKAISSKVFKELKGFDHKKMSMSEDMYFDYKAINKGYRVKYCSKSIVYHSHKFTLKQIYNRYKANGQFFKENEQFEQYGKKNFGWKLAKYVLKRAFQDRDIKVILRWLPDMAARYLGMKAGKM